MIPGSVIARLAALGLRPEQASAVAEMLADVEAATEAKAGAAIEARRASDRERKARERHVKSRDVTGHPVTHVTSADVNPVKDAPVREGARADEITSKTTTKDITSSLRSDGGKPPPDQDAELFRRAREVIGRNAGGQVSKLKAAYDGSIAKARSVIEMASTKDQPAEYVAKAIERVNERKVGGNQVRGSPIPSTQIRKPMIAAIQRRFERQADEPSSPSPDHHFAGAHEH